MSDNVNAVQKQPLTKQEKTKRILLVVLSVVVALTIIGGLIFGSPYSIKKNNYSSFDAMVEQNYDKPTVLMFSKKSCPYCSKVYPQISALKDEYKDRVNFYYVDVQDGKEGTALYRKYPPLGVSGNKVGVPTVHYFYARRSADESLQKKTTVTNYGGKEGKNTYDDILKRITSLLDNPYDE